MGTLVITRLDRLGRDSAWASCIADALITHGVMVVTENHVFHMDQEENTAH